MSATGEEKKEKSIKKAIIFCGNGGVGKSYISNRIFGLHGVSSNFKSSAAVRTVTKALQMGVINRNGVEFTIIDTPGFFDNNTYTTDEDTTTESKTPAQIDGENLCKLVDAMESCEEIYALVYVFTDRFLLPQKHWYDRLRVLMTPARAGQIIVLHNKIPLDADPMDLARNAIEINVLVKSEREIDYFWLHQDFPPDQIEKLIKHVTQLVPFQVANLVIPEICYEREELGPRFTKVVPNSKTEKDEGKEVTLTTHGHKILTETHYGKRDHNIAGVTFGPREKTVREVLVPVTETRDEHVKKIVIREKLGVYVKVWKVRWDGTKDFVEDREVDVNLRTDQIFGDD